ncbi:SDR family oxidoreductase [Cellvibrio sp. PSBB023]|uniref:SDR family oxidoreductase n=1 Tax=Cellvibrio sp. PSBB023 TaxID=1945512 RepID=UPI00098FAA8E|nr:SDR family oxidoreductase [Cellvibrio sp. PSBB023]AQT61131.1 short-chain dehydrogenase [Cellvibrio sp. PSBB023]
MQLHDAVVLITGANRGIGLEFARAALARGARKVYATARDPESIPLEGVIKLKLDVTCAEDVARIAQQCADVTLLINNAGVARFGSFLANNSEASCIEHFETNFYGPLRLCKAFAPILAGHGGGAIINVLSLVSWYAPVEFSPYSASKSAAWALTNSLRLELRRQNTQVVALHMGYVDTDMTAKIDAPKTPASLIVVRTMDALEAGEEEVLADEMTLTLKRNMNAPRPVYLD